MLWQFAATFFCIVGAVLGWPITWLEENIFGRNRERRIRAGVNMETKRMSVAAFELTPESSEYIVPITKCEGREAH